MVPQQSQDFNLQLSVQQEKKKKRKEKETLSAQQSQPEAAQFKKRTWSLSSIHVTLEIVHLP